MSDQPTKANAYAADRCPVCPDPRCPVRPGTFAQAYHHIAMLREAYEMNGDPKSDTVLMGLDPDLEPRPRTLTPHGYPLTSLGVQAEASVEGRDDRFVLHAEEVTVIPPRPDLKGGVTS